jgi:hypothetical protein
LPALLFRQNAAPAAPCSHSHPDRGETVACSVLRYLKDPATGRRVSRANPAVAWITTEVPDLRIVDDDLWARV